MKNEIQVFSIQMITVNTREWAELAQLSSAPALHIYRFHFYSSKMIYDELLIWGNFLFSYVC